MPELFNLTHETKIEGIKKKELETLLRFLENHLTFDGSDLGRADYQENVLHLYPPEGSVMTLEREMSVDARGRDCEDRSLQVSPFLENYASRTFLGLKITLQNEAYVLHRISQAPLAP